MSTSTTNSEVPSERRRGGTGGQTSTGGGTRQDGRRRRRQRKIKLVLKLVQRKRVVRVTKGGRRFSVQTLVVLGDRSGRVGVGIGKAGLLKKACYEGKKDALKNIVEVCVTEEKSIPYESYGRSGGAKVFLRPRPPGAGVLASGPVRTVLEMAGVKNVSAKRLGSRTAVNNARATVGALSEM